MSSDDDDDDAAPAAAHAARDPLGLRGRPRGVEPLSELQPKNADLRLNPEHVHPPLPPVRTGESVPASDDAHWSGGGGGGGDGGGAEAGAAGFVPVGTGGAQAPPSSSTEAPSAGPGAGGLAKNHQAAVSNVSKRAYEFVLQEARQQAAVAAGSSASSASSSSSSSPSSSSSSSQGSYSRSSSAKDPSEDDASLVDAYLQQRQLLAAKRTRATDLADKADGGAAASVEGDGNGGAGDVGGGDDDAIVSEDGGYDTDDAKRIDELMAETFDSRQEQELKKLLRIQERRLRLRERKEKSDSYRGMLHHPFNMETVRRRLNGFSGVDSLKSSYQRHRFRNFRTLRPKVSYSYDKDGNLLRHVKRTYANGVTYEGEMFNGKWHGRGVLVDSSGHTYTGEFKDGEKHGLGLMEFGPVEVPDLPKGPGAFKVVIGQRYEGHFAFGKRVGAGKFWCGNASGEPPFDVYVGEFKDNMFHGEGTMHMANGEVYTGSWRRGHRHGACYVELWRLWWRVIWRARQIVIAGE
jgi:hypothetical protein